MIRIITIISFLTTFATITNAEPPSYKGKMVLFGNLHAHSALSDDVSDPNNQMAPNAVNILATPFAMHTDANRRG